MPEVRRIRTEALKEADLRVGDKILLSGYVYTARDAAHKRIAAMLEEKQIPFTEQNGFIVTDVAVSRGDQIGLVQLCADLGIPCVIYNEDVPAEDGETIAALEKENEELRERIKELEADKIILENRASLKEQENAALKERIDEAVKDLTA